MHKFELPADLLPALGKAHGTPFWLYDAASSSVKLQPVQIASADGNEAVIASGLQPGMQVVATGVHVLTPGQKVTVYRDKYARPLQGSVSVQAPAMADKAQNAPVSGASQSAAAAEAGK